MDAPVTRINDRRENRAMSIEERGDSQQFHQVRSERLGTSERVKEETERVSGRKVGGRCAELPAC